MMIKKVLLWIGGIILVLLVAVFVLLFTQFGNDILKPQIQAQIDKNSPVSAKLETFKLRFGSFEIELVALENINISANGTYSLFSFSIEGVLNILIKNPSKIQGLESVHLNENFLIENVIRGKFNDFIIYTKSNIADGSIDIETQIEKYSVPTKVVANISNLRIESLLNLVGQKAYATGILNIKANVFGDTNLNFTGNANAEILKGKMSESLIKKDFKVTIPRTTDFTANHTMSFDGKEVKHKFNFLSQIGNITSSGNTLIEGLKTNSNYDINISDLSPFSPVAGMPLRGSFRTNGKIQGNSEWLNIDGKSDFASGNTAYSISLQGYTKPKDALVTIRGLKIDEVLHTLYKPIYARATMDAKIDLKQLSSDISGTYNHSIRGDALKATLKKEFDLNPPTDIAFNHNANATLSNGSGDLNANIISNIAEFSIDKAKVNVKNFSINAPYKLIVSDLKNLAFLTSRQLKGNLAVNGNAKYADNKVVADLNSNIFGGKLTAALDRNIADIKLIDIKAAQVLDMLNYQQFFDSNVNGKIRYDIFTSKGDLEFLASGGHFTQNKLMDLLKATLNFDATKEIYESIKIDGKINKKAVNANLSANSKNTVITSKSAKLDFEKDAINAYLNIKVNKDELGFPISGKMSSPTISVDIKKATTTILNRVVGEDKVESLKDKAKDSISKALGGGSSNSGDSGDSGGKASEKIEQKIGDSLKNLFKK